MMTREQRAKEYFRKNPYISFYEVDNSGQNVYREWPDGDYYEYLGYEGFEYHHYKFYAKLKNSPIDICFMNIILKP